MRALLQRHLYYRRNTFVLCGDRSYNIVVGNYMSSCEYCVAASISIFLQKCFKNPYIRIVAGGCFIKTLTLLVADQSYNGTVINVIE